MGCQEEIKNRGEEESEDINVQTKNFKTVLLLLVVVVMMVTKTSIQKPITMELLMEMNILVPHIRARKKLQIIAKRGFPRRYEKGSTISEVSTTNVTYLTER